jgi:hypothetical protein
MALDPTLRSYLGLREWAYSQRRCAREQQSVWHENDALLARHKQTHPDDPRLPALLEEHALFKANHETYIPYNARIIAAIEDARLISFPNASVEDYDAAWRASEEMVGSPDPFEILPFPSCYIGFGEGIVIPDDKVGADAQEFLAKSGLRIGPSVGMLATRSGHLYSVSTYSGAGASSVMAAEVYEFGECQPSNIPFGWLLYLYLAAMSQVPPVASKVDCSSVSARRLVDKAAKSGAPRRPPPPFYKVSITADRFREIVRSATTEPKEWSHRWDVRQHDRTRFLRGVGEVPPDKAAILLTRGYEIDFAPGDDVRAELAARGLPPPGEGEWIATKRWKVKEHIRGPEDKPYVPALRVSEASLQPGRRS